MDFGRFTTEQTTGKQLPQEWTDNLMQTLNEAYADEIEAKNSFFDIYGEIYDQEFVVIASLMHQADLGIAPVSVFISHDVLADQKHFRSVLKSLVDLMGLIFDDVFTKPDWSEYNANWTENKFKGNNFFYKITRENVSLTLQAEEILKKGETF